MNAATVVTLARAIAETAHSGQKRKDGEDYFNHVQRVARRVGAMGAEAVTVGYLHDVIEDTPIKYGCIRKLFGYDIADAVLDLSRDTEIGETYVQFIDRIVRFGSVTALQVKLADLADNMASPAKGTPGLQRRYMKADSKIRRELERRGIEPVVLGL